jgi:hypothetical protein
MQYTVLITALIERLILFCKARIDFRGVSFRQRLSLEIILSLILVRTLVGFSSKTIFTFALATQVLNFFRTSFGGNM